MDDWDEMFGLFFCVLILFRDFDSKPVKRGYSGLCLGACLFSCLVMFLRGDGQAAMSVLSRKLCIYPIGGFCVICFRCLFCSLFFFSRLSLYIPHFACFPFLCIFCICIFVLFWVLSGGWEREPCTLARTSQSREVTIEVRSRFCSYRV